MKLKNMIEESMIELKKKILMEREYLKREKQNLHWFDYFEFTFIIQLNTSQVKTLT